MVATQNGTAWTWVVMQLMGFGDAMAEIPSGFLTAPKLPDEFSARRLTKMVPRQVTPETAQLVMVPWLGHQFKAIGNELRIRATAVVSFAEATREAAQAALEVWEPALVKPATEAQAALEAQEKERIRGLFRGRQN